MQSDKLAGHLASAGAYVIFGFNIIFCKDIARSGAITPIVLFTLRAAGALALFWMLSCFQPREKVAPADMARIALASFLGLFVPQLTFLVAVGMTTSIDTAMLTVMTPIYTMCFAFLFLGEPITGKKVGGVALSLAGVLMLILNSVQAPGGAEHTRPLGVVLMIVNGLSFGSYLGAFRPLISRYRVVTFMKWMFLFSLLYSLPFSWSGFGQLDWSAMRAATVWEIVFVILLATFVAYFLIPIGQKNLRPTLVSMYSYLQPMIAAGVSIAVGMDSLTWVKVFAAVCVFGGVGLVNRSRAASGSPGRA